MANIHGSLRSIIRQLAGMEDDAARWKISQLLQQPEAVRKVVNALLALESWSSLDIDHITVAGTGVPFNCVELNGQLGKVQVIIVVSGDQLDVDAALKPVASLGSMVVSGQLTFELETLAEALLTSGFRLRRPLEPHRMRWHEYQVGLRLKPEIDLDRPTVDGGFLSFVLGQEADRALQVQVAWGQGLSRVFVPGKAKVSE